MCMFVISCVILGFKRKMIYFGCEMFLNCCSFIVNCKIEVWVVIIYFFERLKCLLVWNWELLNGFVIKFFVIDFWIFFELLNVLIIYVNVFFIDNFLSY